MEGTPPTESPHSEQSPSAPAVMPGGQVPADCKTEFSRLGKGANKQFRLSLLIAVVSLMLSITVAIVLYCRGKRLSTSLSAKTDTTLADIRSVALETRGIMLSAFKPTVRPSLVIADNARSAAFQAESLLTARDIIEAYKMADNAVNLSPNDPATYSIRAAIALEMNSPLSAMGDMNAAVAFGPLDATNRYNRALVWRALGEADSAVADLRRAAGLDSTEANSLAALGLTLAELGLASERAGDWRNAEGRIREAKIAYLAALRHADKLVYVRRGTLEGWLQWARWHLREPGVPQPGI